MLSTTALAKRLGISRQYITRVEQGLYNEPNSDILNWACEVINNSARPEIEAQVNPDSLLQLYREWQWQKRESTKMSRILRILEVTEFDVARQQGNVIYYHKIFGNWRRDYFPTTHALCVELCLHPVPVENYEGGNTRTMPKDIREVLTGLGLLDRSFKTNER
jgi:transcriptional regulator with XRE-family HTH domain